MNVEKLIQELTEQAEFYERHSEWERSRAEQATDGSSIKTETMMACRFNEGRAQAMREAIELVRKWS